MLEDKVSTLFSDSTEMYCQGNYEACLALLSDCLALGFDRSIIYSNRSIANYHIKQIDNSFEDLEQALRTNHLNYIAYFNLFSLHFLNGNQA
jgi:tetratricopeptide (TPR) repeat protein